MKLAIIGAGNIGANVANDVIASEILREKISEISLIDIAPNVASGKALDLAHMASVYECDVRVSGGSENELMRDASIVVITAGLTRKAGQSREYLLRANAAIVTQCARNVATLAPHSIIIIVTNPLDMMVLAAVRASGFARERVIGMAGELDSARLKFEISRLSAGEISSLKAPVVGTHNDEMCVLKDEINTKISSADLNVAVENTLNSGKNVVALLGTSAYYAPAAGITKIIKSIVQGDDKTLICSVVDEAGVPFGRFVCVGANGAKIVARDYGTEFTQKYAKMQELIAKIEF